MLTNAKGLLPPLIFTAIHIRMETQLIILDFGSQYTQLIARRIRECGVYCEILPYTKHKEALKAKAVILSGSPFSCLEDNAPQIEWEELTTHLPCLAVCYGAQSIAHHMGGTVERSQHREYGRSNLVLSKEDLLWKGVSKETVWMSHGDSITELPPAYTVIAKTDSIPVAAFKRNDQDLPPLYGLQFHPEVTHSEDGKQMIENFIFDIAKLQKDWSPAQFVDNTVKRLKEEIGEESVVLGLSGGVDSSVAALLLHRAIGDNLHCIFVNNGLLRKNEFDEVLSSYKGLGLNVKGVDASADFLQDLHGIADPEQKRKRIGKRFIDVFEFEAKAIDNAQWLGQGTIYPDVIESVSVHGPSVTIKSHHNVGGLPETLGLKLVEPLRMLFKDEVRRVGRQMNMPEEIIGRHPFPGPGLAIRILGPITEERVTMLQEADSIFITALKEEGLYEKIWQAGAILLDTRSVGVMGDERTYESVLALRAVTSVDGMTADWYPLPAPFLAKVSNQIINQVKGINRVVYDVSSKPPATIEWE